MGFAALDPFCRRRSIIESESRLRATMKGRDVAEKERGWYPIKKWAAAVPPRSL
jgi:hypothetical protein